MCGLDFQRAINNGVLWPHPAASHKGKTTWRSKSVWPSLNVRSMLSSLSCAIISLPQLRRMMCQEAESPSLAGVQRAPISVMTVESLNRSQTVWISISVGLKLWVTCKKHELGTAGSAVHKSLRPCFGDQTHRILQSFSVAGHLVTANAFTRRWQSVSFHASLSSSDNSWPFCTMNHWWRGLPIKTEVKTRSENTGGKIPIKCQWSLQTQCVDTGHLNARELRESECTTMGGGGGSWKWVAQWEGLFHHHTNGTLSDNPGHWKLKRQKWIKI